MLTSAIIQSIMKAPVVTGIIHAGVRQRGRVNMTGRLRLPGILSSYESTII